MIASDFIASEDGHDSVTKATIDDNISHNEDLDNNDEEFDYSDEEEEYLVDDNWLDDDLERDSALTDDDKIFEDNPSVQVQISELCHPQKVLKMICDLMKNIPTFQK